MAQQFFGGTINTLSNLIQQEKRQRFLKQSPEYQQGLFNLMKRKEFETRLAAFREDIATGNLTPSQIAEQGAVLLAGEGNIDPATSLANAETQAQAAIQAEVIKAQVQQGKERHELLKKVPDVQKIFVKPGAERLSRFVEERDPTAFAGVPIRQPAGSAFDRQDYANLFFKFQDRATRFSADFQTVQNNLLNIVASVDRLVETPDSEENRIAVQQAIITSFNKITDPTSVVRESEYARTPEGASLINKLKGAYEKITKGGKLTEKDNIEIKNTAIEIAELRRKILNEKLQKQVREPAGRFGMAPQDVESIAPLYQPLEKINTQTTLDTSGQGQQQTVLQDTTEILPSSVQPDWMKKYNQSRGIK
jgi:hypothetical protein